MTTAAARPERGTLFRFGIIVLIVIAYFLGWFWLSSWSRNRGELELLDQILCPVTFVSCDGEAYAATWMSLLVVNAVSFVIWMLFLLGARGFLVGKSLAGKILGLLASLFIPFAILAVFMFGLVISSIS